MTLGFFSPLPPARSGVAEYSQALLSALQRRYKIRLNRDGDVNLYHLGNNQLHASIYRHALERPGFVVLHDAVLQHFALGYFNREQYVGEFVFNYGDWNRGLAESLWSNRARSAGDSRFFRYPMLKRVAEQSLGIIVHNPAAAAMVRDHFASAKVFEIPHLFAPPDLPHPAEAEHLRTQLGPRPLFGLFGHLRESKRVLTVLRVFSEIPDCTLLLAGEMASSDLRRASQPYLALPNVKRIGYMETEDYWTAALSVDVCINLRYPAAGETSGVSVGFMGAGKTVMMTDSMENSCYPDATCIKVGAGISEAAELHTLVRWLAEYRSSIQEIGINASRYIRSEHAIERVCDLYGKALGLH